MGYAKLSAALLVCDDIRPTPPLRTVPARVVAPGRKLMAELQPSAIPQAFAAGERARLLAHHLTALKLPAFLGEYDRLARQCAADGLDHARFLLRLAEGEVAGRARRAVARRIKEARLSPSKNLEDFDFAAVPSVDPGLVLDLALCGYIMHHENVIAVGNSGTGKTHLASALGLAACQNGLSVRFATAASLVHELLEARAERRLAAAMRRLAGYRLLIIDELGYAPLPAGGAHLLFEVFSQRYERGSTIVTSRLPIGEWTQVFGHGRSTAALLDRLSHRVHLLDTHSDSYRAENDKRRGPDRT